MVVIDCEKCIGCGLCVSDCCMANIVISDSKAILKRPSCIRCGHCVAICPQGAVSIPEYDMADVEPVACGGIAPEVMLRSIKSRRSIRKYKQEPVPRETIEQLIQAGRYTATAKNQQDNRFIFIADRLEEFKTFTRGVIDAFTPEDISTMEPQLKAYAKFNMRYKADPRDDYLFQNAPLLLIIAGRREFDAGMAAQNIESMAVAMGMGTLYNGYLRGLFNSSPEIKNWLGIEDKEILSCMLLGYPDIGYLRTAPRAAADAVIL